MDKEKDVDEIVCDRNFSFPFGLPSEEHIVLITSDGNVKLSWEEALKLSTVIRKAAQTPTVESLKAYWNRWTFL